MNTDFITPESKALSRICNEWYVSFGLITAVVVISLWFSPLWMPLCELLLAVVLALFGPGRKVSAAEPCGRLTIVTVYSLLLTGLVSFAIAVAYHTRFVHLIFDISTLNHSIPYITSLIIFPITAALAYFYALPSSHRRHSLKCHLRNGYNPTNAMFGRIVHGTYRSMLRKMALLCAIVSVIDWVYYFFFYRNFSINTPDRFFFFVVPAAIYAWSIISVRREYSVLALSSGRRIYAGSDAPSTPATALTDSVIMRYFVVQNNKLLVDLTEETVLTCTVDTPLVEVESSGFKADADSARKAFEHRTGITAFKIRMLYRTDDAFARNVVFHFLVTVDDTVDTDLLGGQWIDINAVNNLLKMGVVSAPFAEEIYRIYTMTMAWKTYTRDGLRRYPIPNYRPTFRLSDLHRYDELDYSDRHWMRVSRVNQDNRWWWLRRHTLRKKR